MKIQTLLKAIIAVALIGAFLATQHYIHPLLQDLPSFIQAHQKIAWLLFAGIYVLGTICFLPGLLLTLAGGFLFGPIMGGVINLFSATIGASIAFLIARFLLSSYVERKAAGTLKKLVEGINDEGWRFVAFVRLVPLFPFNALNYALGLTKIGLLPYAATSFVTMAPAAFAYTYLGSLGQAALTGDQGTFIKKSLIALSLIATVTFISYLVQKYRYKSD